MSKFVLGGGIAGLIFCFYNNEFKLLTKDIGGQFNSNYSLGPRLLQNNEYNKQLLKDLKMSAQIKVAKVGYFYDERFHDICGKELRKKYYLKSRMLDSTNDKNIIVPDSSLSEGNNEIEYFDIDFNELINRLTKNINIKLCFVKNIDVFNNKIIFSTQKYGRKLHNNNFKRIVSTIPAPILDKLCNVYNGSYNYLKKCFVVVPGNSIILHGYDYVYFIDKYNFHRVTKIKSNLGLERLVVEYVTTSEKRDFSNEWPNFIQVHSIQIGQIVSGTPTTYENITQIGRYAEWKHSVKIQDVVKKALEYRR